MPVELPNNKCILHDILLLKTDYVLDLSGC